MSQTLEARQAAGRQQTAREDLDSLLAELPDREAEWAQAGSVAGTVLASSDTLAQAVTLLHTALSQDGSPTKAPTDLSSVGVPDELVAQVVALQEVRRRLVDEADDWNAQMNEAEAADYTAAISDTIRNLAAVDR
jgi:hypothetical protein